MATKQDIRSAIALEIGANPEPSSFLSACKEFIDLATGLSEISDAIAQSWCVNVRHGSNLIELTTAPDDARTESAVVERIRRASKALEEGNLDSSYLTEKTLQHFKKLSSLTMSDQGHLTLCLWLAREPIAMSPAISQSITRKESQRYRDYGTLEGTLMAILDDDKGLRVRIDDPIWDHPIPCRIEERHIRIAKDAFRQRVEVSGLINYSGLGRPTSIEAELLTPMPDDADLPRNEDVRGLLAEDA